MIATIKGKQIQADPNTIQEIATEFFTASVYYGRIGCMNLCIEAGDVALELRDALRKVGFEEDDK